MYTSYFYSRLFQPEENKQISKTGNFRLRTNHRLHFIFLYTCSIYGHGTSYSALIYLCGMNPLTKKKTTSQAS